MITIFTSPEEIQITKHILPEIPLGEEFAVEVVFAAIRNIIVYGVLVRTPTIIITIYQKVFLVTQNESFSQ